MSRNLGALGFLLLIFSTGSLGLRRLSYPNEKTTRLLMPEGIDSTYVCPNHCRRRRLLVAAHNSLVSFAARMNGSRITIWLAFVCHGSARLALLPAH